MWQFAGPDDYSSRSLIDVNLVQPLLRAGGRIRVMERLTIAERALLANVRQMEHYRRGFYLSVITGEDPGVLWERYVQLTQIEAAFKVMKSELGLRPIYHQLGHRVEAHILVAFLAYCLLVTLKNRLQALAPGLTPRAVLETLAPIQMLDVTFPTTDGRRLVMPRYTQPTPEQKLLLHQLQLSLPAQPPPRIQLQPDIFPAGMLRL